MNILIYDDENLECFTGAIENYIFKPESIECCFLEKPSIQRIEGRKADLSFSVNNFRKQKIKLNDTLMKRIAKYNKEAEIEELDLEIACKKKRIKELEEEIEDRRKRWKEVQEELPLDTAYEDGDYEDYYD